MLNLAFHFSNDCYILPMTYYFLVLEFSITTATLVFGIKAAHCASRLGKVGKIMIRILVPYVHIIKRAKA